MISGFKKQLRNRQGTAQDFSVNIVYNEDVKGKDVASLFCVYCEADVRGNRVSQLLKH